MNVREALTGIYEAHGELTPEIVVDEARLESSPIHGRFEWDDSVAAERYRQVQAAHLIRSVRVGYETDSGREVGVRAFLAVRTSEDETRRAYKAADVVLSNPVTRRVVLDEMDRDWRSFRDKYSRFNEYAELITDEAHKIEEAA